MAEPLRCYRCGASLAALTLPLSRLDECAQCAAELHVCRMCEHYDPRLPSACREEDAPEVKEKRRANFCDFFVPSPSAFAGGEMEDGQRAVSELGALFGNAGPQARDTAADPDPTPEELARRRAEALFKR